MKALSFRHPVIDAILAGRKTIHVRPQRISHRGDLLLHAGATFGSAERELAAAWRASGRFDCAEPQSEELSALLGVAQLTAVRPMQDADWEAAFTAPREGTWWAWVLESPRRFPSPVRWPGSIRLFDVPDSVLG